MFRIFGHRAGYVTFQDVDFMLWENNYAFEILFISIKKLSKIASFRSVNL